MRWFLNKEEKAKLDDYNQLRWNLEEAKRSLNNVHQSYANLLEIASDLAIIARGSRANPGYRGIFPPKTDHPECKAVFDAAERLRKTHWRDVVTRRPRTEKDPQPEPEQTEETTESQGSEETQY